MLKSFFISFQKKNQYATNKNRMETSFVSQNFKMYYLKPTLLYLNFGVNGMYILSHKKNIIQIKKYQNYPNKNVRIEKTAFISLAMLFGTQFR